MNLRPSDDPRVLAAQLAPCIAAAARAVNASPELARACLMQALAQSGGGKYCSGNNPWHLPGEGDAGWVGCYQLHADPTTSANGGYRVIFEKVAKFSSPGSACAAWFKTHTR